MSEGSKQNLEETGGFFSRWSQRKQAVKQGVPLAEPLPKTQGAQSANITNELGNGCQTSEQWAPRIKLPKHLNPSKP
jgi:hypothetical protein